MATVEHTNGKYVLSVLHSNGWVRHVFESIEMLEKYEVKCYNPKVIDDADE